MADCLIRVVREILAERPDGRAGSQIVPVTRLALILGALSNGNAVSMARLIVACAVSALAVHRLAA